MNNAGSVAAPRSPGSVGTGKALLVSFPMFLLTAMMMLGSIAGGPRSATLTAAVALAWIFLNAMFFLMVKTGKTDRYRSAVFVALAFLFVLSFITNLLELRGSMALHLDDCAQGETPFCHMVIPMTVIPAALTRTIIFPGHLLGGFAPIAGMIILWLGAALALGRGWCSWGCFFGGMDEGFSRLRKKPMIRNVSRQWRMLPFAVLLVVAVWSALTLSPQYCEWFCPFKAVTEFSAVTSFMILLQTIVFVTLFVGLVIVLPVLTRKRTQCGLFCPMGAFQSCTNAVTPVRMDIDREKCVDCGRCIRVCPLFALDAEAVAAGRPKMTCSRCGRCADECPKGAIRYHVKGTAKKASPVVARWLFLYPAFLFLATFGGGSIVGGLYRILLLVTTGSVFQ